MCVGGRRDEARPPVRWHPAAARAHTLAPHAARGTVHRVQGKIDNLSYGIGHSAVRRGSLSAPSCREGPRAPRACTGPPHAASAHRTACVMGAAVAASAHQAACAAPRHCMEDIGERKRVCGEKGEYALEIKEK